MESYWTENGNIFVWVVQLRDHPTTQWIEVKVDANTAANTFHDVLYQYGFNEKAGNFQTDNFKRGGIDGDPIIINVQSRKETDNAYFLTPPDGRSGVLNLHIFTATDPNRDPALDSTVIIHELAHGVSSRLTGGARTKGCMTETASKGLSEGYSDVISLIFTAKPEDTRTLMIQPCDPTFVSARDAMLAADDAYYGGRHKHLIRKGFAKCGLGSRS
ncbi:hypothetical protein BSLG_010750 [Batrachochytrium salamandrivorans]|nr:hypothetical protein BSLG_010750 [Batrachochytrium salamandrivorans]